MVVLLMASSNICTATVICSIGASTGGRVGCGKGRPAWSNARYNKNGSVRVVDSWYQLSHPDACPSASRRGGIGARPTTSTCFDTIALKPICAPRAFIPVLHTHFVALTIAPPRVLCIVISPGHVVADETPFAIGTSLVFMCWVEHYPVLIVDSVDVDLLVECLALAVAVHHDVIALPSDECTLKCPATRLLSLRRALDAP